MKSLRWLLAFALAGFATGACTDRELRPPNPCNLSRVSTDIGAQSCLPRALDRDTSGKVDCRVLEELDDGETCAQFASIGRDPTPVESQNGHEVCNVQQRAVTGTVVEPGAGWYYDDFSVDAESCGAARPQRVGFTTGTNPSVGHRVRLECVQTITGGGLAADINTPCAGDATACDMALEERRAFCLRYDLELPGCSDPRQPNPLVCEPLTNTCQIPCTAQGDDSLCPGGFDCYPASGTGEPICINPTCGASQ